MGEQVSQKVSIRTNDPLIRERARMSTTTRRLGVRDYTWIRKLAKERLGRGDNGTIGREYFMNARESGATEIVGEIQDGRLVVVDNGIGMTDVEMNEHFGDLGSSGKTISDEGNLGLGAKLAAIAAEADLTVTSRKKGGDGQAYRIKLVNYLDKPGKPIELFEAEPAVLAQGVSTRVVLDKFECDPARLAIQCNQRFVSVSGTKITVRDKTSGTPRDIVVRGLLSCMESVVKRLHRHEFATCTLYWGELKPRTPDVEDVLTTEWDAPPFSLGCKDETVKTVEQLTRAASRLDRYGIFAGAGKAVFLVMAKGRKVCLDSSRTQIENWDEEDAQAEVKEALEDTDSKCHPAELAAFLRTMDHQSQTTGQTFQERVREFMQELGVEPIDLERKPGVEPKKKPERKTTDKRDDEKDKKPGGTKKPTHRVPKGVPRVVMGEASDTYGHAARLAAANNTLYINRNFEPFARYLEKLHGPAREECEALIGAHMLYSYLEYWKLPGEIEGDDDKRRDPDGKIFDLFACGTLPMRLLGGKRVSMRTKKRTVA